MLALMVTDTEGDELRAHGLDLALKDPNGRVQAPTPLPKLDPTGQAQFDQNRAAIAKNAGVGGLKDPDLIAERLAAAVGKTPMPTGLNAKFASLTNRFQQSRNMVLRVANPQTGKTEAVLVLNPSSGKWNLDVRGKARAGFFAFLSAGESLKALGNDEGLWQSARG